MNRGKKTLSILLSILLLCFCISVTSYADTYWQYRCNKTVYVNGAEVGQIPVLEDEYANNFYLSLRGMAYVLRETKKAFLPDTVERRLIKVLMKTPCNEEPVLWEEDQLDGTESLLLRKGQVYLGEEERKYSFFAAENKAGKMDAYLAPLSFALLLDMDIQVERDSIRISTEKSFERNWEEIEASGLFQGINALVLGDGTTGDMFYAYGSSRKVAIASTTKLMTYFVTMDAITAGECTLQDMVTISAAAAKLSQSEDGSTPMTEGQRIPLQELLYGLLLPSSNECALAIAEHICGSMEAFVERMNAKAKALGMENTQFFNCHGLPQYTTDVLAAKIQNQMTAGDMFILASSLVSAYPEILDITSTKNIKLETLNQVVKNTNAVLFNVPEVKGLKTGYTNKAGSCLVQCMPLEQDGVVHNIIIVLFGAEEDENCSLLSEMVARFAKQSLPELIAEADSKRQALEAQAMEEEKEWAEQTVPQNPELVIEKLIKMNCK